MMPQMIMRDRVEEKDPLSAYLILEYSMYERTKQLSLLTSFPVFTKKGRKTTMDHNLDAHLY
jgi:hypothetical protein